MARSARALAIVGFSLVGVGAALLPAGLAVEDPSIDFVLTYFGLGVLPWIADTALLLVADARALRATGSSTMGAPTLGWALLGMSVIFHAVFFAVASSGNSFDSAGAVMNVGILNGLISLTARVYSLVRGARALRNAGRVLRTESH